MYDRLSRLFESAKALLIGYFLVLIAVSSVLLALPVAWSGDGGIGVLNAVFTATSAACVTGLITMNTAYFSVFGQIVIMITIQFGGLGIILFSTVFVIQPVARISMRNRSLIREYYIDQVDFNPARIVRAILVVTFVLQAIGALALYAGFVTLEVEHPGFNAVFHAISAFCNAGFSLFADSLEGFTHAERITVPVMALTVLGGIGFVVLDDLYRKARVGRGHRLTLHSKVVLVTTAALIVTGTVGYLLLEYHGAYAGMETGQALSASLFQSVTPRTAGFNTVGQELLGAPARTLTLGLMFTGGAPGSIAGGIKVTTFVIVLLAALFGTNKDGELVLARRRLPAELVAKAHGLFFKAIALLFVAIIALTITERHLPATTFDYSDLLFEAFSAFGTVGLSTGLTPELSAAGRVVVILTMFAGRVGLIALAMPRGMAARGPVRYPTGEIMVG